MWGVMRNEPGHYRPDRGGMKDERAEGSVEAIKDIRYDGNILDTRGRLPADLNEGQ